MYTCTCNLWLNRNAWNWSIRACFEFAGQPMGHMYTFAVAIATLEYSGISSARAVLQDWLINWSLTSKYDMSLESRPEDGDVQIGNTCTHVYRCTDVATAIYIYIYRRSWFHAGLRRAGSNVGSRAARFDLNEQVQEKSSVESSMAFSREIDLSSGQLFGACISCHLKSANRAASLGP